MTDQEFEELWTKCIVRLDEYVAAAKTESQKHSAEHHRRSMEINKRSKRFHIDKGGHYHVCERCGYLELATYVESTKTRLIENKICFRCDFWDELAENHANKPKLIIGESVYSDGGRTSDSDKRWNGFGGSEFRIEKADGTVVETNNLWAGGDVPHTHAHLLYDNAKFLKVQR